VYPASYQLVCIADLKGDMTLQQYMVMTLLGNAAMTTLDAVFQGASAYMSIASGSKFVMTVDDVFQGASAYMSIASGSKFAAIFDTGASLAISGHNDDFIGPIVSPKNELRLGGMANK
jgi:hypothetical protein